ncbi:alpha/beta hydrolase [Streptomyces sp. NBC_00887]|uniref:alpha/beta hydrolase n=1 Tax=Streptomyces sp. NBC_00887 TaxID=2975859 RepID=UPI00386F2EED|nr:alpha/beta hydrolase [Streptomyces sp. NBC_00887]
MPLHPQARALISRFRAQRRPTVTEVPLTVARAMTGDWISLQGDQEPVARVGDALVPGAAGQLPVRFYRPAAAVGRRPLLVYFHGGGWITGGLDVVDRPLRRLANATGAVVASVGYRLAPETQFPGPAEDCYAALRGIRARAAEWGADPDRLAVAGDSAGGNLAAAVCLMARDRGGPRIGAQILIYPVTAPAAGSTSASYREHADGCLLTRDMLLCYWQHYAPGAATDPHPYAAPLHAGDLNGLPPALVLTAEYDPLRDEGEEYAGRLRAADGVTEAVRYDGFIHNFFWASEALDAFGFAVRDIARTLDRHLPGG